MNDRVYYATQLSDIIEYRDGDIAMIGDKIYICFGRTWENIDTSKENINISKENSFKTSSYFNEQISNHM